MMQTEAISGKEQIVQTNGANQADPLLHELLSPKVKAVKMEEVKIIRALGAEIRLPSSKRGIFHSWGGWVLYGPNGKQVGYYGGGAKEGIFFDNAGKPIAWLHFPTSSRSIPIHHIESRKVIGYLKIDNSSSAARARIYSKGKLVATTKPFPGPIEFQVGDMSCDPAPGDFYGAIVDPKTRYMIGKVVDYPNKRSQ